MKKHTKNNPGVIIKLPNNVKYYHGMNDYGLKDLPPINGKNYRTFKTFDDSVIIKNKFYEFEIKSDGTFNVKPNKDFIKLTNEITIEDVINNK